MQGGLRYVGWSVTIAAAVIYIVMVVITLPHLATLAGQPVFDLKPLGYDFGTAQDILSHLGPDGTAYYANVQGRLDAMFPVLACLALLYWQITAGRRWQGRGLPLSGAVLAAILATAVIANAADLGENAGISAMLAAGAKGLTPGLVDMTSHFTLAKTFFSIVTYVALLVLGLWPVLAGAAGRRRP